jgi:hypothetical protein
MNVRYALGAVVACAAIAFCGCAQNTIIEVAAKPDKGFHWPYLLYLPRDSASSIRTLIVAPNNTGHTSDDFSQHRNSARKYLQSLIGQFGRYNTAILMPVFPRPRTLMGGSRVYTHALDRDTMTMRSEIPILNAVRVHWKGPMLSEGNTVSFRLGDILAVQDGMVHRCVASDFDWTKTITGVSELEITFIMREGWDFTRPFGFVESITERGAEGSLFFRDAYLDKKSGRVVNGANVPDPAYAITGLFACGDGDFKETWDAQGSRSLLDARSLLDRLDLQLLAMIDDARAAFDLAGYSTKSLLFGFSASGQFVNRFTLLHPEAVRLAISGGCGGISVPLPEKNGRLLEYPLGTADYRAITGRDFDVDAYTAVGQFLFVGDTDTNDPLPYDDGYEAGDRVITYELFGGEKENLRRFLNVQKEYERAGCDATFTVYAGRGHEIGKEAWTDIHAFIEGRIRR